MYSIMVARQSQQVTRSRNHAFDLPHQVREGPAIETCRDLQLVITTTTTITTSSMGFGLVLC